MANRMVLFSCDDKIQCVKWSMKEFRKYLGYFLKPISERRFTYSRYEGFLESISDLSRYQIVPLKDLCQQSGEDRAVVSLRHDIDWDLSGAVEIARIEYEHNMQATYFVLHTAKYYGITRRNRVEHREKIIPILRRIQDAYGHEIGWHNDLVTLQCFYGIDPKEYLQEELQWLRNNGIKMVGTATHGSKYCYRFKYHNRYFFHDFSERMDEFPNNASVNINGNKVPITKACLRDFNFEYEAYHLPDVSFSFADCEFVGESKKRWHPEDLNLHNFKPEDKVVILTHPCHWGRSVCHKYLQLASFLLKSVG